MTPAPSPTGLRPARWCTPPARCATSWRPFPRSPTPPTLALVTALRSPVFRCGDDDLFTYKVRHGGAWHLPADLDDAHPVVAAMGYLKALHAEVAWLAPAELADRVARDRWLFELGYAAGRPRDLWRRLRFLIDQARAWSESEGGTLREYLEWAPGQALPDPLTDLDRQFATRTAHEPLGES